jgi:hypothetical protein
MHFPSCDWLRVTARRESKNFYAPLKNSFVNFVACACARARRGNARASLSDAMKNVLLLLTRGHRFSLSLNERSMIWFVNCFCNKQQCKGKMLSLLSPAARVFQKFALFFLRLPPHKTSFLGLRRPSATHKIYKQ